MAVNGGMELSFASHMLWLKTTVLRTVAYWQIHPLVSFLVGRGLADEIAR